MQVFCRFLGTHLLQYASLVWMKSAYKCLQSCPLLKQRWRSYFRVTDFYKSLSPLSLIITATINTITITISPLSQYHHDHNITIITKSPRSQYHHYHNINTITTSPLSQHHHYHNITTITTSPLSQHHHYHNITAITKSPLSQYRCSGLKVELPLFGLHVAIFHCIKLSLTWRILLAKKWGCPATCKYIRGIFLGWDKPTGEGNKNTMYIFIYLFIHRFIYSSIDLFVYFISIC